MSFKWYNYDSSKNEDKIELKINKEKSDYKLIDASIKSKDIDLNNSSIDFRIKCRLKRSNGSLENHIGNIYDFVKDGEIFKLKEPFKPIINATEYEFLEIYFETEIAFQIELLISNVNLKVSIGHYFEPFKNHLNLNNNSRILFSAAFGQGKTTFLNEFFRINKEEFEIIKLYPVNYSVSSNEDIFKYIKCEILLQLLQKDLDFDRIKKDIGKTLPDFLKKNSHLFVAPLLRLLPVIGKSAYDIFNDYYKLLSGYVDEHDSKQIDDRKIAEEYLEKIYKEEGGIYEDNIYTQMIRQLIQQIKLNKGKTTILVIDDLDRMDPEHIFRILNVFSAHFDNEAYSFEGLTNKFDFDKVILVCDIDNIRNIYSHKYGENCNFSGYINKYYSLHPMIFENNASLAQYFYKFNPASENGSPYELLKNILIDFINCNEFSVRDVEKFAFLDLSLITHGINSKMYDKVVKNSEDFKYVYFIVIFYLLKLFDYKTLKLKINICLQRGIYSERSLKSYYNRIISSYGFAYSYYNQERSAKEFTYQNRNLSLSGLEETYDSRSFGFYKIGTITKGPGEYSFIDFYNILLKNLEFYEQIGGYTGKVKN